MSATAVTVSSADGWRVRGELTIPSTVGRRAALLVPASKHERDGYGPTMTSELVRRRFAVMTTDIRGRGDSVLPSALPALPPGQLRGVRADVAAAIDALAGHVQGAHRAIVVFAEQDTADAAAAAVLDDERVVGLVLISAKLGAGTLAGIESRGLPLCGLVGREEPASLRSVVEAYCRSGEPRSRLRVVADVGNGTTMFSAWQYLRRDEPSLEHWLAAWAASITPLGGSR